MRAMRGSSGNMRALAKTVRVLPVQKKCLHSVAENERLKTTRLVGGSEELRRLMTC